MANNKLYGFQPKGGTTLEAESKLNQYNPYEFRIGMDYELTDLGCSRLAESTLEEREKATEKTLKNLETHPSYYSSLVQYETEYRNPIEGISKPSFKAYLKEMESYQMIEVDKTYKHDKMVAPHKYKKEDYTVPFKTSKMGNFKLKALKESIKREMISQIGEAKKDQYDIEDAEPTKAQIKGIDKSIGDAKDALVNAMQKIKELGPDIKKLAKETNAKIKKNPAGKSDYLRVYQSDPDVKEFLKLRKMLKSADLL